MVGHYLITYLNTYPKYISSTIKTLTAIQNSISVHSYRFQMKSTNFLSIITLECFAFKKQFLLGFTQL